VIESTPRVSFGVPVRNGESYLGVCLDSILAQDFTDFELIVSDNASTDGTRELLEEYASKDDRIRLSFKPENVGIIENFNSVVRLARGEYFRWVGADDWLEPDYLSHCVAALDADPGAILATTYFKLHYDDGTEEYQEYQGELLDSPDPRRRLARMLWFFHAGAALYEPNYSLIRRRVLEDTGLLRIHPNNDWIMSTQLALAGRIAHVPKLLFHRDWPLGQHTDMRRHLMRLHPTRWAELYPSVWRLTESLLRAVDEAGLDEDVRRGCRREILAFAVREWRRRVKMRVRRFRREKLGLTRERLAVGGRGSR
jgi:glycosyltransferase involved in cell wall biosynthesis